MDIFKHAICMHFALLRWEFYELSCDMRLEFPRWIFLSTIAAMDIVGESENIPSWRADWPHCSDFQGGTYDSLRWSAMLLKASESQKMVHFIVSCGRAYKARPHIGIYIAEHRRQFSCITGALKYPIAGVQHRSV